MIEPKLTPNCKIQNLNIKPEFNWKKSLWFLWMPWKWIPFYLEVTKGMGPTPRNFRDWERWQRPVNAQLTTAKDTASDPRRWICKSWARRGRSCNSEKKLNLGNGNHTRNRFMDLSVEEISSLNTTHDAQRISNLRTYATVSAQGICFLIVQCS